MIGSFKKRIGNSKDIATVNPNHLIKFGEVQGIELYREDDFDGQFAYVYISKDKGKTFYDPFLSFGEFASIVSEDFIDWLPATMSDFALVPEYSEADYIDYTVTTFTNWFHEDGDTKIIIQDSEGYYIPTNKRNTSLNAFLHDVC